MSQIACRVGKGEKGNFVVEIGSHVLIEIEKNTPIPIIGPKVSGKAGSIRLEVDQSLRLCSLP